MFKFALYSLALVGLGTVTYESCVGIANKFIKLNPDNPGIAEGILHVDTYAKISQIAQRFPGTKEELHETIDIAFEMKDALQF